MILVLSDDTAVIRACRSVFADDDPASIARLPDRLTSAAAAAGREIERVHPAVAVIAARIANTAEDGPGVVYRLTIAGETWMPDVSFAHGDPALSVQTMPDEPGTGATGTVSPAAGAACAAAISILGPGAVVMVAGQPDRADQIAERVRSYGTAAARREHEARDREEGGDAVRETVRLGGEIAELLRLTATQRARFLKRARAAAVRGGEVPHPVQESMGSSPRTKAEAQRRLAELEERLDEWKRTGV